MTKKIHISILINGIFILTVLLFVLDGWTAFEIKSPVIKSFTYLGIIILAPPTLIWNMRRLESGKWKALSSILPVGVLVTILIIGPLKIASASSAWRTQTIVYESGHLDFRKVEFQMQDVGAFGYNKRTVEVIYLTDWFMIVGPVEEGIEERVEWTRVDKDINELGLKFP